MKWQKLVEREGDFFKNVLLYESLEEHFPKVFACHHPPFLTVRKGDVFIHYQEEESRKEFCKFLEEQAKDPEFVNKIITTGKKHFQELLEFCQGSLRQLPSCSDKELAEDLQHYCHLYKQPYPYFNVAPFADYGSNQALIEALAEWRLWARDKFNQVHQLAEPLFQKIAQRLHLTVKQLKFLKPQEIIGALHIHHTIQCRQQCYFHFENGSFVLKEDSFPEFLEEGVGEKDRPGTIRGETTERIKEFQGRGTFPAKYTGRVRVIRNNEDLTEVVLGEILVLRMTTPDLMMESIRKAGAIITDEGGITSHAAVISREFNIPALMGTEIATTVLKTGDLVEVDTEKGMAKLL